MVIRIPWANIKSLEKKRDFLENLDIFLSNIVNKKL